MEFIGRSFSTEMWGVFVQVFFLTIPLLARFFLTKINNGVISSGVSRTLQCNQFLPRSCQSQVLGKPERNGPANQARAQCSLTSLPHAVLVLKPILCHL